MNGAKCLIMKNIHDDIFEPLYQFNMEQEIDVCMIDIAMTYTKYVDEGSYIFRKIVEEFQ